MKKTRIIITMISILLITNSMAQSNMLIELHAQELISDSKRDKIYAIVNDSDSLYANAFVQINPYSGDIERNIPLENNPFCMKITHDENYIYVSLYRENIIKRINLNSFQVDQTIVLPEDIFAKEIEPINTSPDLIIISLTDYSYLKHEGMVAYYKGKLLPNSTPASHLGYNTMCAATDTNLVFSYGDDLHYFRRMSVDTIQGISTLDITTMYTSGSGMVYANRLLYFNDGNILDPFLLTPTIVGMYPNNYSDWEQRIAIDSLLGKAFLCANDYRKIVIRSYNLQTMNYIETLTIDGLPDVFQWFDIRDFTRFGNNGLAILIDFRRIILHESCFVIDEGPDLAISVYFPENDIIEDHLFDIKFVVTNKGAVAIDSITMISNLHYLFEFTTSTISSGNLYHNNPGMLKWDIDSLKPNQKDSAIVTIRPICQGLYSVTADITSPRWECHTENNHLRHILTVNSPIGINDITINDHLSFSYYPNPTNDYLFLDFDLAKKCDLTFRLLDIQGREFLNENVQGQPGTNKKKIDLHNLSNGIYILAILIDNTTVKQLKVVKQ
ncbi:T9SS type A sorting domain-containing protein [Bacteroidales bacterium OttesenSCG-928-B11]|nr:T9SS type A sorting domain-containing protein [Bacteroidales bacterium OttesenSCG-928-C03]MDL2312713.1 T9SS type A sorting domain-containing protein [Bacteroidales bacterium OttesenSCG-928-B11]MDL2326273.1 T9SS type A sorting domain-containing protein [Bacteroidales bacterium OttesenSCG-928-A14]